MKRRLVIVFLMMCSLGQQVLAGVAAEAGVFNQTSPGMQLQMGDLPASHDVVRVSLSHHTDHAGMIAGSHDTNHTDCCQTDCHCPVGHCQLMAFHQFSLSLHSLTALDAYHYTFSIQSTPPPSFLRPPIFS